MEVSLTDVYEAVSITIGKEGAKLVTTYLEQKIEKEYDIRKSTIVAELKQEIEKAKSSTIWAFVLLMVPTWTALFILLYNVIKH